MTTTETTLYSYRIGNLSLGDAISSCESLLVDAIALCYSPQACQVARLSEDGKLYDSSNQLIDLLNSISIFEARVFTHNCELRWLNRMDGLGKAVLLTESDQSGVSFPTSDSLFCEWMEQQYLLWGEKATNQPIGNVWQRLAEARIGKLDIPLNQHLEKPQRVYLKTREYLKIVDDYGNFGVVEERLVALEVM